MKAFLITTFLCLTLSSAFASSGETSHFLFDGTRSDHQVTLSGEKTHTEYETEYYETTCSREVYTGEGTVCRRSGGGTRCRQGTNICEPVPEREECHSIPTYRTEYYSCTQSRTVSHEVYDYPTEAVVSVKVLGSQASANEDISIRLHGEELSVTAKGSKNFIIEMVKRDVTKSVEGNVRRSVYDIELSLTPAAPVLAALNIKNMLVKSNAIDFDMGPMNPSLKIATKLRLAKRGLLGGEDTFYNEVLPAAVLKQTDTASGSHFRVELKDVNQKLDHGKFGVELTAFYQASALGVINEGDFKSLESNFKVIYKIR
ncbi:MAG: hypothetical protein K2P81_03110 [Bacteriovoracaceae bacterium]|nr:hypothetical protein [Bacteriovoracaceae bacterium]